MRGKSDSQLAMVDIVERVGKTRASRCAQPTTAECSAVYSCASNGIIERGVGSV